MMVIDLKFLVHYSGTVKCLLLSMQSVPITTSKVVSSNPAHDEVYSIQHYAIKFVSDLPQVCGFLRILRFPLSIKLTGMI
jgi:hypothetical protein